MPFHRLRLFLRYRAERFISAGMFPRIIFIALLILCVVVIGGTLLWIDEQGNWWESLWWAFLRMSDPGYLGDDEGAIKRVISTAVTIAGYVLFMGALIAIMTTWLHQVLREAELGLTPISLRNHIVILGWSERTPAIIHDLLASDRTRLRRFLSLHGTSRLHIAVLVKEQGPEHEATLRQELGPLYKRQSIIFRHGEPDDPVELTRVNPAAASSIIFSGGYINVGQSGSTHPDGSLLRSIMTIDRLMPPGRSAPHLVTSYRDRAHAAVLGDAYRHGQLLPVCAPLFIGRMMAQSISHPGLLAVIDELFDQRQAQGIFLAPIDTQRFTTYGAFADTLRNAVAIGLISPDGSVVLNPPWDTTTAEHDQTIVIAARSQVQHGSPTMVSDVVPVEPHITDIMPKHLLVLGCNRVLPYLLNELADLPGSLRCTCLSLPDSRFNREQLAQQGNGALPATLELIEGDPLSHHELLRVGAHQADAVIILCDDRAANAEEADGRVLLAQQELERLCAQHCDTTRPTISIELRAPSSRPLTSNLRCDRLISGEFVSHAMAQISLRPELLAVYDSLFASKGPGLAILSARSLLPLGTSHTAATLRHLLADRQLSMLGYIQADRLVLNPAWTSVQLTVDDQLQLIVCMEPPPPASA